MDRLRNMEIFCRVVELGSFTRVAREKGVTPAIIGRHVAELEDYLRVRLINRTTRSMDVTTVGRDYYEGCKAALEQISGLEEGVKSQPGREVSGLVRVAAPEGLGTPFLLDLVETIQQDHPGVLVDLVLENTSTDTIANQIDVAIRFAISLEDSSFVAMRLATTRLSVFASPGYLASAGEPATVEELWGHACLNFGASRYGDSWPLLENGKVRKLHFPWKLTLSQTQAYLEAIERGMGLGLTPDIFAAPFVADGRLVRLALSDRFPEIGIFALSPSRRLRPRVVSLFLERLSTAFADHYG